MLQDGEEVTENVQPKLQRRRGPSHVLSLGLAPVARSDSADAWPIESVFDRICDDRSYAKN